MKTLSNISSLVVLAALLACSPSEDVSQPAAAVDPLPSWNDGDSRRAILDFVARVTDPASPDFVPEAERIATFDNDGTLWAEQPLYFQLLFALDRVRSMADEHPEWRTEQPFKAILEDDREALAGMGHHELGQLMAATHTGISSDEFGAIVREWLDTVQHPRFEQPFDACIYQPMLEVLSYLRANGFKTFIASGGGIDFIRVFAEDAYGIPPEQVIGSSLKARYEVRDGQPVIVKIAELNFIDDKAGKPVGIHQHIGRRPIAAFGNSDGDFQMLEWATTADGPSLGVIVHHDDPDREYAYDRGSKIGGLDAALDEAEARDWTVISMRDDWRTIFP
jgi:phosphoglycolate phosphatase-like HAD superfamily hydrolase